MESGEDDVYPHETDSDDSTVFDEVNGLIPYPIAMLNYENSLTPTVISTNPQEEDAHVDIVAEPTIKFKKQSDELKEMRGRASVKRPLSDDEDDGSLCPICLDNWTNTGEHRICALKCGHLFGDRCLKRWIYEIGNKSCPTCKKKVRKNDVRYIYAKKVKAIDTTELEAVKKQLEVAIEEKNKLSFNMTKSVCKTYELEKEIDKLKQQITNLKNYVENCNSQPIKSTEKRAIRVFMDKSLEVCKQSGCRVLDTSSSRDLLVTSMKSPNNLFNGYGLRTINISSYKPLSFIPTHTQAIRDVCFHPEEMWVLSAGLDKALKIVDLSTNTTVHSTSQSVALWSCCWDADNSHILYAGAVSGSVFKYDVRNFQAPLDTISVEGDMSSVVSVASVSRQPGQDVANGGIICCKLNSLWFFENATTYIKHSLPIEGPFISMRYQRPTRQILVSSRANSRSPFSRHSVATLAKEQGSETDKISCNVLHSFKGGLTQRMMSRSCFVSNRGDYVAAYQESHKCVYLWSINTGQKMGHIIARDVVLDLASIGNNKVESLISLTGKKLEFFKFC